jgi:hypothetical protein
LITLFSPADQGESASNGKYIYHILQQWFTTQHVPSGTDAS